MPRHPKKDRFTPLTSMPKNMNIMAFDTETREKEPCPLCGNKIEFYGRLREHAVEAGELIELWCPSCSQWVSVSPTETEEARWSEFVLGCVYDGETFWDFWDREIMINFLMQKQWAGYQCWATNLEYDLNALFEEPDWPLFRNYFGGILKGADLIIEEREDDDDGEKHTSKLHFCDTLNQWKASVDELGKLLGLPKGIQPDVHLPTNELAGYCRRDAQIVYDMAIGMQDKYGNDLGCKMTGSIASSAMDLFRRGKSSLTGDQYMQESHGFKRLQPKILDFFQVGYFGGRTENFVIGDWGVDGRNGKPIYEGDIRSMYPSVMVDTPLPILTRPRTTRHAWGIEKEGMARVRVRVKEQMYPPLPYRHYTDASSNKLYFPIGEWNGIFTTPELRYALGQGVEILKIYEIVYFERSEYIFRDYVQDLYKRRMGATSEIERYMYKIFMNSLYGKFGQIGEVQRICPDSEMFHVLAGEEGWSEYGSGFTCQTKEGDPALFTNFIWSAFITGGARCMLHEWLVRLAGLYCDTDSVFSEQSIGSSEELGAMDCKGITQNFQVLGPKVYRTDTAVKVKGVSKKALGLSSVTERGCDTFDYVPLDKIKKLGRSFIFERPIRFREGMARGIKPNTWQTDYKYLHLLPTDMKRKFFDSGKSRPFTINEVNALCPPWSGAKNLPYYKFKDRGVRGRKVMRAG